MNEHCVPKINIFLHFFEKWPNVAQISIPCFAKFREIRRKFRETRNWKFREITKMKLFAATLHMPRPQHPFRTVTNFLPLLSWPYCTSYFQHIPRWLFFLVSDAFTWAGDAGGVQIWSFLTLPVWGQFSLGRSYKKYPASGGAKICGAWEYLIAPASQSKLGFSSPRSSDLLNTLGLFKT